MSNQVKKFILHFECNERTRWLYADEDFMDMLANLAKSAASMCTQGDAPRVTVSDEKGEHSVASRL